MKGKKMTVGRPSVARIGEYYDRHSLRYLEKYKSGELFFNESIEIPAVYSILREKTGTLTGKRALDVGCGLGSHAKNLSQLGAEVTAIDVSQQMIEMTRRSCESLGVCCRQEDLFEHTPRFLQSYDIIVAGFMLGYFDDLASAFKKLADLTSSGGILIVSSIHPAKISFSAPAPLMQPYFKRPVISTDFLSESDPLTLFRWRFDQVVAAARMTGFTVDQILEPKPAYSPSPEHQKRFEFYCTYPSVAVYSFWRR
jgi:SAM-dependent methyltransferase